VCLCELAWQQNGLVYSASVGCLLVVLLHVILVLEWFSLYCDDRMSVGFIVVYYISYCVV